MTVLSILGTVQRYEEFAEEWYVGFVEPRAELVFADGTRASASTLWRIQGKGLEERMASPLKLGGLSFELRIGGRDPRQSLEAHSPRTRFHSSRTRSSSSHSSM